MSYLQNVIPMDRNAAIKQLWSAVIDIDLRLSRIASIVDIDGSLDDILKRIKAAISSIPGYSDSSTVSSEAVVPGDIDHNTLGNLQGGAENDYYHLTSAYSLSLIDREMEEAWNNAYKNYFSEFTWDAGVLTDIDIYDTSSKTVHIFKKEFSYTESNITGIVTTRYSDSKTLTKTFLYDTGLIKSITVSVS